MKMRLWHNDLMRLFLLGEKPKFLQCTAVKSILWPEHGKGEGLIVLETLLPMGVELLKFRNGDDLGLVHGQCGDPSDYQSGELVISFRNCQVNRKWIMRPQSIGPHQSDVRLRLLLNCEIEVFDSQTEKR